MLGKALLLLTSVAAIHGGCTTGRDPESVRTSDLAAIADFAARAEDSIVVHAYPSLIESSVRVFGSIQARQRFYERFRQIYKGSKAKCMVIFELLAPDQEEKLGSYYSALAVHVGLDKKIRYFSYGPFWDLLGHRLGHGILDAEVQGTVDAALASGFLDKLAGVQRYLSRGDPVDGDTAYSAGPVLLVRWINAQSELEKLLCWTSACGTELRTWHHNELMNRRTREFVDRGKSVYEIICKLNP